MSLKSHQHSTSPPHNKDFSSTKYREKKKKKKGREQREGKEDEK